MASQVPEGFTSAQHFALIYIDQYGRLHHGVSPSIVHYRDAILSPRVTSEFLKAVANSPEVGLQTPSLEFDSTQLFYDPLVCDDSYDSWFRNHVQIEGNIASTTNGYHEQLTPWSGHELANPATTNDTFLHKKRSSMQKHSMGFQEAILYIKDSKFLRRYYEKVFENFQQTNCRVLTKAYVKLLEPQKQAMYPYNGRRIVAGEMQQLSPEESKPPWWPPEVRHREPDHLLKPERIALLVHILCDLRCSHGITSERLKSLEQTVRRQIIPVERLELLDELYRVRGEEEKFLEGFLDRNATVIVSRTNLPTADIRSDKKDQRNISVSSKHK